MKKTNILCFCFFFIIIIGGVILIINERQQTKNNDSEKNRIFENNVSKGNKELLFDNGNNITLEKKELIDEIKNEINAEAECEIYDIKEEYDGRKILVINTNFQLQTILAGIVKGDLPEEKEIMELINKIPNESGIWIPEKSRKNILMLLKENNLEQFKINTEGYIYVLEKNKNDDLNPLYEAINSDKLFIIDMQGNNYIRDELTGKIVENPFEKMDSKQIIQKYYNENIVVLELITNKNKRFTSKEILNELLLYLQ